MKKGDKLACTGGVSRLSEDTIATVSKVGRKYTYVVIPGRANREYRISRWGAGTYRTEEGGYYLYTQKAMKECIRRASVRQIIDLFRPNTLTEEQCAAEIRVLIEHAHELPAVAKIVQKQEDEMKTWDTLFEAETV